MVSVDEIPSYNNMEYDIDLETTQGNITIRQAVFRDRFYFIPMEIHMRVHGVRNSVSISLNAHFRSFQV